MSPEIDCFYGTGDQSSRRARINVIGNSWFVEFYEDNIMVASVECGGDLRAQRLADKYVKGLLTVKSSQEQ